MRQKDQLELSLSSDARGGAPSGVARAIEARAAKACLESPAVAGPSMEAVVEGENLKQALAQVKRGHAARLSADLAIRSNLLARLVAPEHIGAGVRWIRQDTKHSGMGQSTPEQ